jgi:hypothetical protein
MFALVARGANGFSEFSTASCEKRGDSGCWRDPARRRRWKGDGNSAVWGRTPQTVPKTGCPPPQEQCVWLPKKRKGTRRRFASAANCSPVQWHTASRKIAGLVNDSARG